MYEFIGTIQPFAFGFAPVGWALCDGQILEIKKFPAVFSLFGTKYGGDGRDTFGLPDLRGRFMVHAGQGAGLSPVTWGEKGGTELAQLYENNLPSHNHVLSSSMAQVYTETKIFVSTGPVINEPDNGNYPFASGGAAPNMYSEVAPGDDFVGGVTSQSSITGFTERAGGSLPFNVRNPFLGLYICVCLEGIYPRRN